MVEDFQKYFFFFHSSVAVASASFIHNHSCKFSNSSPIPFPITSFVKKNLPLVLMMTSVLVVIAQAILLPLRLPAILKVLAVLLTVV